jgi:hypothetical protein
MPGPRTYQAIGFTTYQAGRLWGRRKRAELERQARIRRSRQRSAAAGISVALVVGLGTVAVVRSRRAPSI